MALVNVMLDEDAFARAQRISVAISIRPIYTKVIARFADMNRIRIRNWVRKSVSVINISTFGNFIPFP